MSFIKEIKEELRTRPIKEELEASRYAGVLLPTSAVAIVDKIESLTEKQIPQFTAGVFLSSAYGSFSDKVSGYHIEFVFQNYENAAAFGELLAAFDIMPKTTTRGGNTVIYIKSSEDICNLLALVGASRGLMEFNNMIALRQLNNDANRRANCDARNIEKQVNAAHNQVTAIKTLIEDGRINNLDEKLRAVANARLNNQEANYQELADMLGISKSGVVHRLKKIMES
jgi:hypothetical protein